MGPIQEGCPAPNSAYPPPQQGYAAPSASGYAPQPAYAPFGYPGPQTTQYPSQLTQYPPQAGQYVPQYAPAPATGGYISTSSTSSVPYASTAVYASPYPAGAPGYPASNTLSSPVKPPAAMVTAGHVVTATPAPPVDDSKCVCTSGWLLFGLGFWMPCLWVAAIIIACCIKNKNNRRAGIASAVMIVACAVVVGVVVGMYGTPGECRDMGSGTTMCYNKYSGTCIITNSGTGPYSGSYADYCGRGADANTMFSAYAAQRAK